jgi:hypothetical protein
LSVSPSPTPIRHFTPTNPGITPTNPGITPTNTGITPTNTGITPNTPNVPAPDPGEEYFVLVGLHNSGERAFLGNEVEDGEMKTFAALVPSESMLDFIYTGQDDGSAVNIIRESYFGGTSYGWINNVTVSHKGRIYDSYVFFDNNSGQTNYFASTTIDGSIVHLAVGDKLHSIPSGSFSYQGGHFLFTGGYPQSGTFTMNVDFSRGSASLQANTTLYSVSANDIVIGSSGQFETNNLSIYNPYTVQVQEVLKSGELDGIFTGLGASGVVGVYSSSDGTISGTFTGSK